MMRLRASILCIGLVHALLASGACGDDEAGSAMNGVRESGGRYTPPSFGVGASSTAIVTPEIIIAPERPREPGVDPLCGDGVLGEDELCDPSLHPCCSADCRGVRGAGEICRAASAACDVPEACDGESFLCPRDALSPAGTECRASAGDCDVPEACDGRSAACPRDGFAVRGTLCREADGICDVAETCTGESASCPEDAVVPLDAEVVCRAADVDLACDAVERCDGEHKACPANRPLPRGTQCQTSLGTCDAAEVCDGTSFECPPPTGTAAPAGTMCRIAAGACDVPEVCDGRSITCPPDALRPGTHVCRSAAPGGCDREERCTGASPMCPPNAFEPATTECRPAAPGGCDVAERCFGDSAECPVDRFDDGAVCRAAVPGGCDREERCDGTGAQCPPDAVAASGTVCRPAAPGGCDREERCDGERNACPANAFEPRGTVCRAAAAGDLCDAAETCPGESAQCPADGRIAEGGACNEARGQCSRDVCCPGETVNDGAGACDIGGSNLVFVTSVDVTGALPSLAEADALCTKIARDSQLAGTYHAWISATTALPAPVHARTRVSDGPYVLVNGTLVARGLNDLIRALGPEAPLDRTEWNERRDVPVWTGTAATGDAARDDCAAWSSAAESIAGQVGQSGSSTAAWTEAEARACSSRAALYCIQDDCPGAARVDFQTDPDHCGVCGNACATTCVRGVCAPRVVPGDEPSRAP